MSDRIVRQSRLRPAGEGLLPLRIVLWQSEDGRLATHVQVEPGAAAPMLGPYRVWGHYHGWNNLAADKDFDERLRDYELTEVIPPDATLAPSS